MKKNLNDLFKVTYDTPEEKKQAEKEAKVFKYIAIFMLIVIALLGFILLLLFFYFYIL